MLTVLRITLTNAFSIFRRRHGLARELLLLGYQLMRL